MAAEDNGLRDGEVSSGTTIMAVEFDGGVVMGADSRTSTGTYVANRVSDKIVPLHDKVWVCRSGSAADTQALADMTSYYLTSHAVQIDRTPTVATAASLMRRVAYENKDYLMAGLIVAGYDEAEGGQVFSIPLGGTLMRQPVATGGSGSTYVYGLVDADYKENMTRDECVSFVSKCVAHAMARDGSSGGVIRLVIIDENGVEKRCILGDDLPYGP